MLLVCSLAWPPRVSESALAVVDVGAIAQLLNTVSNLMRLVGLQTRDIAALANLGPILQMIAELQFIAGELEGIYNQMQGRSEGWVQLGHPSRIPCTSAAQADWSWQASEWGRQTSVEISQAYGLIMRSMRLMQSIIRLANLAQVLFGTTSGLQSVTALSSVTVVQLQKIETIMVTTNQAIVGRHMHDEMIALSGRCIRDRMYDGFGAYTSPW